MKYYMKSVRALQIVARFADKILRQGQLLVKKITAFYQVGALSVMQNPPVRKDPQPP